MTTCEPEEPTVFATEVKPEDVLDRSVLVDSPRGRLALIADRPSCPGPEASPKEIGGSSQIVAIDAWCPHLDGPLWEGSARDGEIACPWHRWRYSLTTGQCTWAPKGDAEEAAETEIQIYPTREGADGCLEIILKSKNGPPTESEVGSE